MRRACKAMLALKHRSGERGRLKPGEMQVGTAECMKNRPEYKHVINWFCASLFWKCGREPQKRRPRRAASREDLRCAGPAQLLSVIS